MVDAIVVVDVTDSVTARPIQGATVVVAGATGQTDASGQVTFTIPQSGGALTIQPFPALFTFSNRQVVSYQFVANGGTPPYTFIWSGSLPAGLTLSTSGLMSGVVNQPFPGSFLMSIDLTVYDPAGDTYSTLVQFDVLG